MAALLFPLQLGAWTCYIDAYYNTKVMTSDNRRTFFVLFMAQKYEKLYIYAFHKENAKIFE